MANPLSTRARIARGVGLVALGLVLGVYIGVPVAMAIAATWPTRATVGPAPTGFRDQELTSADGLRLACWYSPPENGAAIILLHGAGGSRESVRAHAEMLAGEGFGVLAVDVRGHGKSAGATNRLGWEGTRDVEAAVEFLTRQPGVKHVGGVGSSMGGEILLGASAACPQIEAIVADGATRRCTSELTALDSERSLVRSFTARVMYAAVGAVTQESPPAPLLGEMIRSDGSEFLFVAAGDNDLEVAFNERFARSLEDRAELWVVPDVGHTGAISRYPDDYERRLCGYPDDYERRLCGFLEERLLGN